MNILTYRWQLNNYFLRAVNHSDGFHGRITGDEIQNFQDSSFVIRHEIGTIVATESRLELLFCSSVQKKVIFAVDMTRSTIKKAFVSMLVLILCRTAYAWESCSSGYELSFDAAYGFNTSWSHYGGASLSAYMPFHRYFEAEVFTQYISAGDFTSSVSLRPKYALPVGELFIDGDICYKLLHKYRISDFCASLSFGYRMNFVSAQIGCFTRKLIDMDSNSTQDEAINFIYRVSFNIRPATSVWNLGGGISNFTEFEYERPWQPIFFLNGHYSINPHLRAKATVYIKPTGIFHLTASFYGIRTELGVIYSF